jgi:hypothetical protein
MNSTNMDTLLPRPILDPMPIRARGRPRGALGGASRIQNLVSHNISWQGRQNFELFAKGKPVLQPTVPNANASTVRHNKRQPLLLLGRESTI